MGDRGGSSRPGCKWHPRQQGEGVCAQCLRTSLEKLAAYQGEYQQESLDTFTGAFPSTSLAEFSRERDANAQSFQPTYPNVSYRTRSKKEPKTKGGVSSQDGSTSDSRKTKDATGLKVKLTWGGAVHRIASLRSAFTSLWKSDRQTEEKRKQSTGARDKHHSKPHGHNRTEEERKEKYYEQQHVAHGETGRANGEDSKRNSISSGKTTPGLGSSSFVSKFTLRSSHTEDPQKDAQSRWSRSKSSREAKQDPHIQFTPDQGPRTPDGNPAYDALSPLQPVPHPSSKSSPWRFFSRSGSRRSPHRGFKVETPNKTPKSSTAFDSKPNPGMSNPLSRGFSPRPETAVSTSKSAFSSPSMAKPDPHSQTSLGSKSTSWSRTLSPSSSKPSPLYLAPRTMGEIQGDSPSRDSMEFLDESKSADAYSQKGTRYSIDGAHDSTSPHSFESSNPPSNIILPESTAAQNVKTERSSIMSVAHKVDWPRVMPVQATKSPLFKRPDIPRGGSDARKLGAEAPLHMTGRGKASVAS